MNRITTKLISGGVIAAMLSGFAALPAFAQAAAGIGASAALNASATAGGIKIGMHASGTMQAAKEAKIAQLISTAQSRADQEITRRINALNALSTRINNMVKVSASDKSSLSTEIQTQVTAMNTLQAQIASDAAADSTSSLKTDIQSITKAYRIFALVVPQGAIEAAADRVLDVAGMLTTLSAQLQTRITDAQNAGNNVSAETTAIADMNAKIADANTQANAATTEIASLQPDNGDQTIAASNTATLKDARSKIQAAQQDLTTARKDAGAIAKALFALKNPGVATTTTSVGGSASASSSATVTASGTSQ